ncbi:hypothetical protein [Kineosporia mesophila]|uniref:hypothetical protein n=1 Tax=Kineosporia mesophila TaxID=566012 RepID=UPI001E5BF6CB|nr:hypothetical protein [Kineosporia mesophila]MCD5351977.1 hypothetical protein [Kineosporia mesophila]
MLNIEATPGKLRITLDVVLRERHPMFTSPVAAEQYCYQKGSLTFEGVSEIHWSGQESMVAARDNIDGQLDFGGLDDFVISGESSSLTGNFGFITVISRFPILEMEARP